MGDAVGPAGTVRRHRPIIFVAAGLLLTHGPMAVLGVAPSRELIKELAEFALALVAGMMTNPAVPARIRQLINVESGLNDGFATPIVLIALAGAGDAARGHGPAGALVDLALGLLTGTWAASAACW